jgi:predicted MFS family arabinose efflux permease
MVLAAMVGMSFYAMINYSFGQFIEPVSQEFHWSRASISLGLSIFNLSAALGGPLMGLAIDRFGARRIALPGIVLASLAFAALSLADSSLTRWYVLWLVFALVSLAIKSTVWSAAVSHAFVASRGLALSLMLCGSALAQALAQLVTNAIIVHHGWRAAYQDIALGWGGLAIVLVVLFFRDTRKPKEIDESGAHRLLPGLTIPEAVRNPVIWRIGIANLVTSLVGSGVTVHMMPLLTQTGLTRNSAAAIYATAGLSGVAGKLITGWMMDRWQGNLVPFTSYAFSAIGYVLLLNLLHTPVALTVGVMVLGYTAGAALQVSTYLISRYAGLRNFATVFGAIASMMYIGSSGGGWVAGLIHDRTGSYDALLLTAAPVVVVAALLMLGLGAYPRFAGEAARTDLRP